MFLCVELLDKYKSAITKRREAEAELNEQLQNQAAPDMKVKLRECKDTEEQLKQVETRLGRADWFAELPRVAKINPNNYLLCSQQLLGVLVWNFIHLWDGPIYI